MQVGKTDSLALFVLFILVLNSYERGIVPCVSSQSSDMGFYTGREDMLSRVRVSAAKGAAADPSGFTAKIVGCLLCWEEEESCPGQAEKFFGLAF